MQTKRLRYDSPTATRDPYLRKAVADSAIEALLENRFNFYRGDHGEVVVHDPEHYQVGLNPAEGCRAVVHPETGAKCQCETWAFLGGLCVHTVSAFIWANAEGGRDEMQPAA